MRHFEKAVMLQTLDSNWKEHLAAMDYLRQGIHLRGYAQKNPKQEYKREAFEMFSGMLDSLKQEVVGLVSRVQIRADEDWPRSSVSAARPRRQPAAFDSSTRSSVVSAATRKGNRRSRSCRRKPPKPFVRAGPQGRPQRTLPLRLRQEVQAMSWTRPVNREGSAAE